MLMVCGAGGRIEESNRGATPYPALATPSSERMNGMTLPKSTTKQPRLCEIDGCGRNHYARGFCSMHYRRLRRTGTTDTPPRSLPFKERFWAKVDRDGPVPEHRPDLGPCWLWAAGLNRDGYGRFGVSGTKLGAHRVAYELLRGPIPDGLELDHLCRAPCCVNPDHLEPVTHRENCRRGFSPSAKAVRTGLCEDAHYGAGCNRLRSLSLNTLQDDPGRSK